MSRLIVKNIPTYVTPEKLRAHFEQQGGPGGTLTDVKVSSKRDGTSRRFGFVGFKSNEEATAAQKWFNRTFIDSTRIEVVVSEGAKDAPAPRPAKRRRLDVNVPEASSSSSKPAAASIPPPEVKDGKYEEFMKVMQPKKVPVWANEATAEPQVPIPAAKGSATQGELSDAEWLKQRMSNAVDLEERVFEQSDDDDALKPKHGQPEIVVASTSVSRDDFPKDATKDTILKTSRLFVRNLTFSCTEEDLTELFKPFGEISQIHIPVDSTTKLQKGLAYVTFVQAANAVAAYEALDRRSFQGRLLHILAAVDRRGNAEVEVEGARKTLKDEKHAKRKAMAGKEFNWSMLYMNSDAVASSIADRMNISKSDILNPESGDNAAVKLALAETHIIQETKTYLEGQGVLLSSFSSRSRSATTILVKNIPYGTTADQIRELFEPHGELSRVLVPPAGTMAVVEFEKPDEAAKGFRAVAYRRLGNSIIYLEKGPLGMFIEGFVPVATSSTSTPPAPVHAVRISEQVIDGVAPPAADEPALDKGTTLYIKNLSFTTTQERLHKVFAHLPGFSFARVQTKPDPKRPDARLSMGYGFMGFADITGANAALKSVQGFVLDGHALHVTFAGRGADEPEKKKGVDATSRTTKMIVKNVPFEATRKDIRDLFGSHGHLKSVRLPKKFDSRSRGFAFLEFVSRHEAENAFAALRHTHLLGRHLVLEWAEEAEQDLDVLRKKAGVGFANGAKDMPGQKRKLDFGKNIEEDVEDLEA
ncbi:hypothetical protein HYPSUDRAFT_198832 [Hypholoma sublateritium FD-334 SS-4]|uniref:Multiple RNA-binding domain-containing protein 1 n=1 Tax=Hypholoma sublateritium (strain FD-334 SS-4) TaxID=945553 RepID=A0A0D2P6I1_HYPSF|nr:hypothetical protein HYPSUDRAFT_198832 [Hypholoma sublateritium FD-334 SS-4]